MSVCTVSGMFLELIAMRIDEPFPPWERREWGLVDLYQPLVGYRYDFLTLYFQVISLSTNQKKAQLLLSGDAKTLHLSILY